MEKLLEKDLADSLFQKIKRSLLMIYFSIPVMISNIGSSSIMIINSYYAGHMNDVAYLAAVGIANSWIAFIGLGPLFSCNFGFFALVSQVNGTGNETDLKIICQRGFIFNLIIFGISSIILLMSPIILPLLGVEAHIIQLLTPYINVYIICLFSEIFIDMMRHLLNAQKLFTLYTVTSLIGTILHFIQCAIFFKFEFGLISLAFSKIMTNIFMIIILVGYMKYKKINGFLIESFEKKATHHLWDYAKNVIPSGTISYVEWMAFELTTIMASNFNDVVLSAHTIFLNILSLNYRLFMGVGLLYSSFLGNALGKKDLKTSKILKDSFNTLMIVLTIAYIIYVKLTFELMINFMTNKEEVREALSKMVILTYTLCCFDSFQGIIATILRAVGYQNYASGIYLLSYYGIGTPLGLIFGVGLKMTIVGWFGGLHLAQGIFCFLGHKKFHNLKMEDVLKEVEQNIESQFSENPL